MEGGKRLTGTVRVQGSKNAALPVLAAAEPLLEGFEVVQGSMDDVFLNVTGKTTETGEGGKEETPLRQ